MLTEDLLAKVRLLEIQTRRTVSEVFAGEFSSAFKGRGMEFADVRAYQPGDDVRTIDWNVTARTGEPQVKRYVEERELTIVLAVDLSASGSFGSVQRPKAETMAELCAVLAFAAVKNNDKVGMLAFTDRIEHDLPPRKGTRNVLRIVRDLLDLRPAHTGTDIAGAAEHLARVLRRRAVVFLVSDFLDPAAARNAPGRRRLEQSLRLLARRHDVIALRVTDPREHELPRAGLLELADPETGERALVDTDSRAVRRRFARAAERSARDARDLAHRCGLDFAEVVTHEPYIHTLVRLFKQREGRR